MYVRVYVGKCSDCRRSKFNLLNDILLASLLKPRLPGGCFGRATRKTLSLTGIHHVCSRSDRRAEISAGQRRKNTFGSASCTFLLVLLVVLHYGSSLQGLAAENQQHDLSLYQYRITGTSSTSSLLVGQQQMASQQCPSTQSGEEQCTWL